MSKSLATVLGENDHVPFGSKGVQLAYGRHPNGRIIHISEAERGIFQRCVCPSAACGRPLIAILGDEVAHHFRHAPLTDDEKAAGTATACSGAEMTALHEFAQQILARTKRLRLPPVEQFLAGRRKCKHGGGIFNFDHVELEKRIGCIIPDVIANIKAHRLLVEIFVAHKCSQEKIDHFATLGVAAIEINLSQLSRAASLSEIEKAITDTAPREWRYHPAHTALREDLEREEKEERQRSEARQAKASANRRANYARDLQRARELSPVLLDGSFRWHTADLCEALHSETGGEGFFAVHPTRWKFELVSRLESGLWAQDAVTAMSQAQMILRYWQATKNSRRWNVEADLLADPAGAVERFLEHLEDKKIAHHEGGRWTFELSYKRRIIEIEEAAAAEERARIEKARRSDELSDLALRAVALGGEKSSFKLDAWLSSEVEPVAPSILAEAGGSSWIKLKRSLNHLIAVLEKKEPPPAEALGLPVVSRLTRIQADHDATVKLEQERRVSTLESEFTTVRKHRPTWLDEAHPQLRGRTPRDVARESQDGYLRIATLLADLKQKVPWETKLIEKLEEQVGTRKRAMMYATQTNPKLHGKRPIDVVRCRYTLDTALAAVAELIA